MMANENVFNVQILQTLQFEGGYSNDPVEPGGETNFGISKAAYPNVDIRNLTQAQAVAIYHRDYWLAPKINQLPDVIAGKVFDMGVNMGTGTAIKLFQETVNEYDDLVQPCLVVDGQIGQLTLAASNLVATKRGSLLANYCNICSAHYISLIRQHPAFEKFRKGWLRRAAA